MIYVECWSEMKKFTLSIVIILFYTVTSFAADRFVSDELLVRFDDSVSSDDSDAIIRSHKGRKTGDNTRHRIKRMKLSPGEMNSVKAALKRDPRITFVEPNYIRDPHLTPNDTYFSSEWHLPKISSQTAWDISSGKAEVVIAVLDTGVDPSHPDLSGKLVAGYNFVADNSDTHDVYGHGTKVAGSAAAISNNGVGVTGVAWGNRVMPLMISDATGSANDFDLAQAIEYAADHGSRVINISFGGPDYSFTLQNAVNYAWNKGAVIVASAGNNNTTAPSYPAACNNVLSVAATDQSDKKASFSSYGNWVGVSAPGVSIYTTTNGGGYGIANGTSFSAPITAGVAALILSVNPSLTNQQVVNMIVQNADSIGISGMGSGRINLYRSLVAAKGSLLKPGDCDGNGQITIDEVQGAINMYLGLKTPAVCVDVNSNGVTIDEVQKVINGYLGL